MSFSQNLTEVKLNDDVFVSFHLPEYDVSKLVYLQYQQYNTNSHSSLDDYISHFTSHFSNRSFFGFGSEKLNSDKAKKDTVNLMDVIFSTNRQEENVSI